MDFLSQNEIGGFKQDIKHGEAKQMAEKLAFEKKLLEGLGDEMIDEIEHPEKKKEKDKFAKKYTKEKRRTTIKENLKKIFGGTKKETV